MVSLKDFRALIAVADEGHFGRAAERLGIAQPQLSEIIRRQERRAKFEIFTRRPRVSLTRAGELYVGRLRLVLQDSDDAMLEAQAVAAGESGIVRLGFAPVSFISMVPSLLRRFRAEHPAIQLRLTETHSQSLWDRFERGGEDLIISRQVLASSAIESRVIIEDELVVALPKNHPLAQCGSLSLAELGNEDFVSFSKRSAPDFHALIRGVCLESGLAPNVVQEVDGWSSILSLVSAGMGVSIVSKALTKMRFPGVKFVEIEGGEPHASFWLSWPKVMPNLAAGKLKDLLLELSRRSIRNKHVA